MGYVPLYVADVLRAHDLIAKIEGLQLPAVVHTESGSQKTEFIQLEVSIFGVYNMHISIITLIPHDLLLFMQSLIVERRD